MSEPPADELPGAGSEGSRDPAEPVKPPRRDESFPRAHRLTAETDFRRVLGRGFRHASTDFSFHVLANELGHSRLGMTVPRKAGSAVVRNRIRRRIRESFRRTWSPALAAHPADLVVRALPSAGDVSSADITAHGLMAIAAWERAGFRERGPRRSGR